MPLYEYECSACRNHFEVRQRIADEPISVCPSCGGAVRRVIHAVGIIFKGSGFYVTDNRKTEAPATTPSDEKPSTEKPSTEKTATDKPAPDKTSSGDAAKSGATSSSGTDSGSKSAASTTT